ncbi:hypothetical protein ABXV18_24520 [Vibrio owensii]|uniref:cobaltochelatase CobT-related protein n=1 Tax=Vibrio owensii TaxID=696485 RepID=UPI0033969796
MDNKRRIAIVRETITKVTRILSGRGIRVTQSGMNAFVEYHPETLAPVRVNIPFLPDDASNELISAIEGFVDHEVGHLLFSDAKVAKLSIEKKVGSLTNICEDVFIERMMKAQFTGSSYNLEKMYHIFTDKFIEPKLKEFKADPSKSEREYWHLLVACALRALGGQRHFIEYMTDKWSYIPNIKEAIEPFSDRLKTTTCSMENMELAIDIKKAVYGSDAGDEKPHEAKTKERKSKEESEEDEVYTPPSDLEEGGDEYDYSESGDKEPEESEPEPDETESEPEEKPSEEGESEYEESEEETESEEVEGEDDEPEHSDEELESMEIEEEEDDETPKLEGEGGEAGVSAPLEAFDGDEDDTHFEEFDDAMSDIVNEMSGERGASSYFPFTKDWDRIEEFPVPPEYNSRWSEVIESKVTGMTGTLQKGLERAFRAANKSRWEGGKKRGRVNNAALSRLLNNDPRVFRTREEMKTKEVAVTLLIDCSGSMSGGRINVATETAWALAEVLSKLNINFEVLGFTTDDAQWRKDEFKSMYDEMMGKGSVEEWSRLEPVYIPIFKGFNERFGVEQKKRLSSVTRTRFLANNVDGESLEYAAERLLRQKEPGKTIIVLSDGAPCAYGSTWGFQKHLKEVVANLKKKQVNIVGIGIQTDSVKSYFPKSVVIDRVEDLPTTVMHELREAIMQK